MWVSPVVRAMVVHGRPFASYLSDRSANNGRLRQTGDRGQPSCGWCVKNNQLCEYKERKKPGLRAGYGRELEARLGMPFCPDIHRFLVAFAVRRKPPLSL